MARAREEAAIAASGQRPIGRELTEVLDERDGVCRGARAAALADLPLPSPSQRPSGRLTRQNSDRERRANLEPAAPRRQPRPRRRLEIRREAQEVIVPRMRAV